MGVQKVVQNLGLDAVSGLVQGRMWLDAESRSILRMGIGSAAASRSRGWLLPLVVALAQPARGQGISGKEDASPKWAGVLPVGGRSLERVMGIEPTLEAWEAPVLPLNYTRVPEEYREESSGLASARCPTRS
jgi:hypothetical protein